VHRSPMRSSVRCALCALSPPWYPGQGLALTLLRSPWFEVRQQLSDKITSAHMPLLPLTTVGLQHFDQPSRFRARTEWMDQVRDDALPALHSFVTGLEYDLAAVTAGLTLPWEQWSNWGHREQG
jgi:hypothetical protein